MSGNGMSRCVRIGLAAAFALAAFDVAAATSPEFYERANQAAGTKLPFSEAVRAGDMLYLAGELGVDASGKLAPGGVKAETKQMMDNIGATLARHGSSFDRVVSCTVALADISEWAAFNEVYRGYFKDHFPARMAYGANGLALNARVEMQCTAAVGK